MAFIYFSILLHQYFFLHIRRYIFIFMCNRIFSYFMYSLSARYIRSTRGANLLMFCKFIYRRQCKPSKDGHKTWYCAMYGRSQCPSVLTTDSEEHIIQIRGIHNHPKPQIFNTPNGVVYKHPKKQKKTITRISDVEILP
ncbi:unnamed protein product [Diatraea saccharalis]|uniref:FLYWCH-type domain-containing protein n=1 Tax=Diatraea saccharalis TaxID=40085 RepID=A0A9N9R0Z8_9NEOP|nr:unnamed protein product [Diatraea saccharalis]